MRETNSHIWAFDLGLGSIGAWLGPIILSASIPFSASDGETPLAHRMGEGSRVRGATGRMRCSRVQC